MPLGFERHKWLYRLLAAVALYLLCLPVWWFMLPALTYLSVFFADLLYRFFDPQVSIQAAGRVVNFIVTAPVASGFGGQEHRDALRLDTVTYGLPLFAALALVTRASSWRAKLRALLIGIGVLSLLAVPTVMVWAKLASLDLDAKIAQANFLETGDQSSFVFYALHGYAFSQPVVAVLLWIGLMMLGFFKARPREQALTSGHSAIARNAPCRCGSGRKFKRCCGRT